MNRLILVAIACVGIMGVSVITEANTNMPWQPSSGDSNGPNSWGAYERGRLALRDEFKIVPDKVEMAALVARLGSSDQYMADETVTTIMSMVFRPEMQSALRDKAALGGVVGTLAGNILADHQRAFLTSDRDEALAALQEGVAGKDVRLIALVMSRCDGPSISQGIAALQNLGDRRAVPYLLIRLLDNPASDAGRVIATHYDRPTVAAIHTLTGLDFPDKTCCTVDEVRDIVEKSLTWWEQNRRSFGGQSLESLGLHTPKPKPNLPEGP